MRTFQRASALSPVFSNPCALFCTSQKAISFVFMGFRTLCTKHPGWGERAHVLKENRTGGGGVTRRGGRLRRNSSTTDSWNGQVFSAEKFFPKASSTLFITARPRRMFLLRTRRNASQEPG